MPGIVYDRLISKNGWSPPKNFFSDTSFLVRRITTSYQHLDPSPLQEIYEAVMRWHMDHNARLIPDQATLSLTLDRSVQILQAVNGTIMDASRKMKKRKSKSKPSEEEIAAVREFVRTKPNATRDRIKKELRAKAVKIGNDKLAIILDDLRGKGEYKTKKRKKTD